MSVYEVKKFTNKSLFELIKETKSNFNKKAFLKKYLLTHQKRYCIKK